MIDETLLNSHDANELVAQLATDSLPTLESADFSAQLRVCEAILFAASAPLDEETIALHLARGPVGQGADVPALMSALRAQFASRGVVLFESGGKYSLRSAPDLADYLKTETTKPVKLGKAMAEVLAIIAYHQPVTRAEVEAIRGVATSKGTLDFLMEVGWVRPGHRRDTPGRPLTWITTPAFLDHFGLAGTHELPGMEELKAAGLLESKAVATYGVLNPSEAEHLAPAIDDTAELEPEFLPSPETGEETVEISEESEQDNPVSDSDSLVEPEGEREAELVQDKEVA